MYHIPTYESTEPVYIDEPIGITIEEYENMSRGLRPCGCGVIEIEPSIAYPTGHKVIQCNRHRGVRTYGA